MSDSLYELLAPVFEDPASSRLVPNFNDPTTAKYLSRLATLQLSALETTEPQSLAQASHSTFLSLQSLSTRSSKSIIASSDELKNLRTALPALADDAGKLQDKILALDKEAIAFAEKYSRSGENEVLERRKKALLMLRNVDRLSDILDLPTLLSSAISSSTAQGTAGNANYASALDLHSHIRRLHLLYQDSELLQSIYNQAKDAMRDMTSNLIMSLRGQTVKLAAGMRTIGWLRRIAPELDGGAINNSTSTGEGSLGALFLVCRLANLLSMLAALEPLRELADQESQHRLPKQAQLNGSNSWSGGQQTERYLKRYIEIFREQSFAIISTFRSIFPSAEIISNDDMAIQFKSLNLKTPLPERVVKKDDPLLPSPSALATFSLHLVELLTETLRLYMPNVVDKASRESLLTQVLYCAGSLGRLGGDFGMALALLEDDSDDGDDDETIEWVTAMKKQRVLSGRLEQLASGVGGQGRMGSKTSIVNLRQAQKA